MKNQTNWASPKSLGKKLMLLTMKGYLLFFCALAMGMNTDKVLSQQMVVIESDQVLTVDEVFDLIMEQTEYNFIYQVDLFKGKPRVVLKKGKIKVDELLQLSLASSSVILDVTDSKTIIIQPRYSPKDKKQQGFMVTGVVSNENGVPLPGVTVQVKDMNRGVATDFDGNFKIEVPDETSILVFSSIGYQRQEVVVGNLRTFNINLKEDVNELDEVVLNAGYYKTSEKLKTGSISSLAAVDIEKQPVNNPLAAMQGRLSGVNIVQNTGVPGGGMSIEIRGRSFINGGTDPLFIIDGVPFGSESIENSNISAQINQGNVSPLNAINPQDIESIEVLKDADATAIYGSRGANGVVLITTKKGKAGKTQFNANLSTTFGSVSHFRDLMDTQQYLEVRREGAINDGRGALLDDPAYDFVWPDIKSWDSSRYTDWQEELIGGTAYRNNAQISVSGGGSGTQFLISGAHQKETTVFPGDANYKKTSMHNNINHRSKNDRFAINFSAIYTLEDNNLPRTDLTSLAYRLEPNAPEIYDDEGNLNWENNTFDNPLASLQEEYRAKINTLIANFVVSYEITPELMVKTSSGYNSTNLDSYRTLPSTARNPRFGFTPQNYSQINTNVSKRHSWIVEPQLIWNPKWKGINFEALLGSTFQRENTEQFVQRARGFASNKLLLNISAAESLDVLEDSDSEYNYQAFYGRLNLNYNDRYILNLTGRRDGSSRFGPGKQYGNFGAAGVAWVFSNEGFLKDNPTFNFGKIRASYGTTGSDNIGDYRFLDTYRLTGYDYNGVSSIEPTGIFNPLLAWEENRKLEMALELGFFNDRIFLNAAWYRNRSSNQLIGIPLASTTGFNSLDGNFDATVQNTGFELDLNTVNLRGKNFGWSTTINLTVPKNELLEFEDIESSTFANRYIVGKPLSIIRFYKSLGVDPNTGIYLFEDFNDDGQITGVEDRQVIRDLSPKFYGGLANKLTYKNFSLDFFFQFKKQLGYNFFQSTPTAGLRRNGPVELYGRWQEVGDLTDVQRATAGLNFANGIARAGDEYRFSDATLTDASFIRLRSVSLAYSIPKEIVGGVDLNFYVQGQNLLTITNYTYRDPEQRGDLILPQLRQITLGLNFGF